MAVRAPAPEHPETAAHPAAAASATWSVERRPDAESRPAEGRAERWATWVLIYLAVLTTSLAIGASAWALGLIR